MAEDEPSTLAPLGQDFVEILRGIIRRINETEDYLGVPRGTIYSPKDSDFVTMLKVQGALEPMLADALTAHIGATFEHPKVHFDGVDALKKLLGDLHLDRQRTLAVEFGIISKQDAAFIEAATKIRGHYAHHVRNASLNLKEIYDKVPKLKVDKKLLDKLIGMEAEPDLPAETIRLLMLGSLSYVLARLMSTIKPPPKLGLLGALMQQEGWKPTDVENQ